MKRRIVFCLLICFCFLEAAFCGGKKEETRFQDIPVQVIENNINQKEGDAVSKNNSIDFSIFPLSEIKKINSGFYSVIDEYESKIDEYEGDIEDLEESSSKNKDEKIKNLNKDINALKEALSQALKKKDKYGLTPLFYAVRADDYDLVEKIRITYSAEADIVDKNKESLLLWALKYCTDKRIIESLIKGEHKADVNYKFRYGDYVDYTPLLAACVNGNPEIINCILESDDLEEFDKLGSWTINEEYYEITPLGYISMVLYTETTWDADREEYKKIIQTLLDNGALSTRKMNLGGFDYSPIQYNIVFKSNHYNEKQDVINNEIIELLINNTDEGLSESFNDMTTLFFAVLNQNRSLFDLVLSIVDTNCINYPISRAGEQFTVLAYLLQTYQKENSFYEYAVNQILNSEKRIDTNASYHFINGNKVTPLGLVVSSAKDAMSYETKRTICEKLLQKEADPNENCEFGDWECTPLHYVAKINDENLYDLLTKNGAEAKTKKDNKNHAAIYYKAQHIENNADKLAFSYVSVGDSSLFLEGYKGSWENYSDLYTEHTSSEDALNMAQIALLNDDVQTAELLLDGKIEWDDTDANGWTSFDYAVENDCDDIVRMLISKNVNVGNSLFRVVDKALETGNTTFLSALLLSQADYRFVTKTIRGIPVGPAIYAAIKEGIKPNIRDIVLNVLLSIENVPKISKTGLNSVIKDNKTPVLLAEDEGAIIHLLEYGADPESKDSDKKSIKDYAFLNEYVSVIDYLLEHKIPLGDALFSAIESELQGQETRMAEFIEIEGVEQVSKLLKQEQIGSKIALYNPLVYVSSYKHDEVIPVEYRKKVIAVFLSYGMNINERIKGGEFNGFSALLFAAKNKQPELVDFLLQNGADVKVRSEASDSYGRTALFYSLENKDLLTTTLLLENMNYEITDIQLKDKNTTLLMYFAKYGDFNTVYSVLPDLLENDVYCLERKDADGMTPFLYAAAYNQDINVLKVFRMYGADVYAIDRQRRNAYQLAVDNENTQTVLERLESYGVLGE